MVFIKSRSTPSTEPQKARLVYFNDDGTYAPVKQPLALLYTSAQLYQETSLLPFAMNGLDAINIEFLGYGVLSSFLEGLSHNQRNAIATLHVDTISHCLSKIAGKNKWEHVYTFRRMVGQLSGLQRIVVHTIGREDNPGFPIYLDAKNEDICHWVRSVTKIKEVLGSVEILPDHRTRLRYTGEPQSMQVSAHQRNPLLPSSFLLCMVLFVVVFLLTVLWLYLR